MALDVSQFLGDVAAHRMHVLRDDGLYRHLRFRTDDGLLEHFDILTWPGHLCVTGDMGTYVFYRTQDMFKFFRSGPTLSINLPYWSEKLVGVDRGNYQKFSEKAFRAAVWGYLRDWLRYGGLSKAGRRELWDEVCNRVLSYSDEGEHRASWAVSDFDHEVEGKKFSFDDFFEHTLTEYTNQFEWCCFAITWGIRQYDQHHVLSDH